MHSVYIHCYKAKPLKTRSLIFLNSKVIQPYFTSCSNSGSTKTITEHELLDKLKNQIVKFLIYTTRKTFSFFIKPLCKNAFRNQCKNTNVLICQNQPFENSQLMVYGPLNNGNLNAVNIVCKKNNLIWTVFETFFQILQCLTMYLL